MRITLAALAMAVAVYAQTPVIPSYKTLKYPPLPQVKVPEPVQVTLSNGMKVFLLEDHELPLIRGFATIRTGNLFDPPDKRGLSQVTAEVLRSGGTKAKSGDQIDEELENMAAAVESSMDETSASVSFNSLKESTDAVLATFKDVITNPEFRQDKIDLILTQWRGMIARRNDEASEIPSRELASIIYGRDNSYGWTIEYEHLDHIKRDDLIAFYRRYYFPKNIALAIYGDFKADEMRAKLEGLFADWKVEQPPVPAFPQVTAKPAPGIYLAEKFDVTQTFFAIGHLGGTLRDKDYAALEIAADILGSGFKSRLMSQIRTKLGYAYSISAGWAAQYDHPGTFLISGSTKSASTVDALKAIQVELEKMRTTLVTAQELEEAKQAVLNSFVFAFDNPQKTLNRLMRYDYYGYPKDFLFQYQKAISTVTREDVLRVTKEHFLPQNLTIVAAGNPKEFGKAIDTLGPVNKIDLTIPEPKREASAAQPGGEERARALLGRAAEAMGGMKNIAAIQDAVQSIDLSMSAAAGGMKMKQTNSMMMSGLFRQEQNLPFGKVIAFTDGTTGWLSTPQGILDMPPEILRQAQGEWFRHILVMAVAPSDASKKVNAVGPNEVEISSATQNVRVTFDPATGLMAGVSYREGGAEVKETFADWREVGAIRMPYKIVLEQNGNNVAEGNVTEYRFNTGLTRDQIAKKP